MFRPIASRISCEHFANRMTKLVAKVLKCATLDWEISQSKHFLDVLHQAKETLDMTLDHC